MSAFLGPIHFWLFKKIRFQEKLTQDILSGISDRAKAEQLEAAIDEKFGRLPEGELENLIDTGNIHGWLQGQIQVVEKRFACLVTEAQKIGAASMNDLKEIARRTGEQTKAVEAGSSCKDAYQAVDTFLLNGMPCDRVNVIVGDEDRRFVWQLAVDIHGAYWEETGGNPADYYEIRSALFEGMLAGTGLNVSISGNEYAIFA